MPKVKRPKPTPNRTLKNPIPMPLANQKKVSAKTQSTGYRKKAQEKRRVAKTYQGPLRRPEQF